MSSAQMDPQSVEYAVVTLLERVDALRRDGRSASAPHPQPRPTVQAELRTLEFWRATISECLATFFLVFVVCGAGTASGGAGASGAAHNNGALLATSLAAGFAMATLYQCFGHISGAHANPAVTAAMAVTRNVTPLRALVFVTAQCGGGIAGAALVYGVTSPGYPALASMAPHPGHMSAWERFGVELILSFLLVLTYCGATDGHRRSLGGAGPAIGAAYLACSLVSMPSLNPARALGPAFVMNKWENHWVYWTGPVLGGVVAGLVYEFIFSPRRQPRRPSDSIDGDSSSIHSDDDPYDDLDKGGKMHHGGVMRSVQPGGDIYRPVGPVGPSTLGSPAPGGLGGLGGLGGPGSYCPSLTSASLYASPPCKLERVESLYGGTKSLYAKSPPLTRANLNRSQSVYTKSPGAMGPALPRPGPLVPAQSLYPMRLGSAGPTPVVAPHCLASQQSSQQPQQPQPPQQQQEQVLSSATHSTNTTTNQNVQNQQNAARHESVYGVRGAASGAANGGVYGVTTVPQPHHVPNPAPSPGGSSSAASSSGKHERERERRPESVYGMAGRRQDSNDSSYGSYQSSAERERPGTGGPGDRDQHRDQHREQRTAASGHASGASTPANGANGHANGHANGGGAAPGVRPNYAHLPPLPMGGPPQGGMPMAGPLPVSMAGMGAMGGKCVVGGSITVTSNGNYGAVRHAPHGMAAPPQPHPHQGHHQGHQGHQGHHQGHHPNGMHHMGGHQYAVHHGLQGLHHGHGQGAMQARHSPSAATVGSGSQSQY